MIGGQHLLNLECSRNSEERSHCGKSWDTSGRKKHLRSNDRFDKELDKRDYSPV